MKPTLLLILASGVASPVAVATPDTFGDVVQPFLKEHCFGCHGPEKQKARIRYDRMDRFRREDRHLWTRVHEQLSEGEMPPESRPMPRSKRFCLGSRKSSAHSAPTALGGSTGANSRLPCKT